MKFYKLTIETLEPVIIGYDSSNESRDIISGTAINGIFIKENIKDFEGNIEKLILSKDIIFTDAYLQNGEDYFIPTPKSFLCDKHDMKTLKNKKKDDKDKTIDIKNCLLEEKKYPDNKEGKEEKKKDEKRTEGLGSRYINIKENSDIIEMVSLKKIENMHINKNINDGMDSLYRYEAIEKGQNFYSLVILKKEDKKLQESLYKIKGTQFLGKSKSTGYGKVTIRLKCLKYKEFQDKLNINRENKLINEKQILNIYFLTDAILKDKYGNTVSILPKEEIKDLFKLDEVKKLDEQFVTNKIIGGYNSHQKIPMPKDMAVEAGSIIRYSYEGNLDKTKIEKIEEDGIGYFRERGFGRVIINPDFTQLKLGNYQGKEVQDTSKKDNKNKIIINLDNKEENNMFDLLKQNINKERELDKIYKIITLDTQDLVIINAELENSQVNNFIKDILKDEFKEDYGVKKDKIYNDRKQIKIFNDCAKYFLKKLNSEDIEGYKKMIENFIKDKEKIEIKYSKDFIRKFVIEALYYHLRGKENE